jgi:hypothetical protein
MRHSLCQWTVPVSHFVLAGSCTVREVRFHSYALVFLGVGPRAKRVVLRSSRGSSMRRAGEGMLWLPSAPPQQEHERRHDGSGRVNSRSVFSVCDVAGKVVHGQQPMTRNAYSQVNFKSSYVLFIVGANDVSSEEREGVSRLPHRAPIFPAAFSLV